MPEYCVWYLDLILNDLFIPSVATIHMHVLGLNQTDQ